MANGLYDKLTQNGDGGLRELLKAAGFKNTREIAKQILIWLCEEWDRDHAPYTLLNLPSGFRPSDRAFAAFNKKVQVQRDAAKARLAAKKASGVPQKTRGPKKTPANDGPVTAKATAKTTGKGKQKAESEDEEEQDDEAEFGLVERDDDGDEQMADYEEAPIARKRKLPTKATTAPKKRAKTVPGKTADEEVEIAEDGAVDAQNSEENAVRPGNETDKRAKDAAHVKEDAETVASRQPQSKPAGKAQGAKPANTRMTQKKRGATKAHKSAAKMPEAAGMQKEVSERTESSNGAGQVDALEKEATRSPRAKDAAKQAAVATSEIIGPTRPIRTKKAPAALAAANALPPKTKKRIPSDELAGGESEKCGRKTGGSAKTKAASKGKGKATAVTADEEIIQELEETNWSDDDEEGIGRKAVRKVKAKAGGTADFLYVPSRELDEKLDPDNLNGPEYMRWEERMENYKKKDALKAGLPYEVPVYEKSWDYRDYYYP